MLDLQEALDRRLVALRLAAKGEHDPQYDDIDVSKEAIKKKWIDAGIMDANGHMRKLKIG